MKIMLKIGFTDMSSIYSSLYLFVFLYNDIYYFVGLYRGIHTHIHTYTPKHTHIKAFIATLSTRLRWRTL